jgi:cyclopropane fatty-acyl-phospholipid synthase-like methyltransferase
MRQYAPATRRNRDPILGVLARVVPAGARVLEIGSGTGEHAVYFASRLPAVSWQPSDPSAEARASVDAWRTHEHSENVAPAIELDVTRRPWDVERYDIVVSCNMIHIAPFAACEALLAEAPLHLNPRGVIFLYGPFKRAGAHTAQSNDDFDRSLRARDGSWGVRDLEEVVRIAGKHGMQLEEVVEMPANNLSVILRAR